MRLTIQNSNRIVGQKIDTNTAEWEITGIEARRNDYRIYLKFNYGKVHGMKHPKYVQFTLLRYTQYETIPNEWAILNNWNSNTITLTKGLLQYKMFIGILGGILSN